LLPFLIAAFVIAWIKGYKPFVIFRSFIIYPFLALEIVFWVFQYLSAKGNLDVIRYAGILKTGFFLYLILPVFYFKLYRSAIFGCGLVLVGTLLNKLVMNANGGKMPVKFTFSNLTGFSNEATFSAPGAIHIGMSEQTKMNFLGDIFDFGYCVMSIGDIIMKAYFVIVFYNMIVLLNNRYCGGK
jgi:hypothetical protein